MAIYKDDWAKTRTQGRHFTGEEKAVIRFAFDVKLRPDDVARKLKCSSRNIRKYYEIFRGRPAAAGRPKKPAKIELPVAAAPQPMKSRFYRSSFELEG